MGADAQHHRASDAEREAVADRLRAATAEGRLDPSELDERLTATFAARTRADLVPLTADLPDSPAPPPAKPALWSSEAVRDRLATFVIANVISIVVWAATGPDGSFWPKWVILGTGIALFASIVHHVLDVEERDEEERERRSDRRRHDHDRHRHDRRHPEHGLPGPPDPPRP
ncbi:MAG TPA: DUF1707 domain-containing protein [Solirubrobacteraceae bacterium]